MWCNYASLAACLNQPWCKWAMQYEHLEITCSYTLPVGLQSHLQMSMDVLWILTIWCHGQISLLQTANSGGKPTNMHEQGIHCFKAYVYRNTLQWAVYDYFRILCNAFLAQNCGGNRHILIPGELNSCHTDRVVYTMKETEDDLELIKNAYRNTARCRQGWYVRSIRLEMITFMSPLNVKQYAKQGCKRKSRYSSTVPSASKQGK